MVRYYGFCGTVARKVDQNAKEFYRGNGKWEEDDRMSLNLNDAMMDYGDWSPSDYDDLTEEQAMEWIKKVDELGKYYGPNSY